MFTRRQAIGAIGSMAAGVPLISRSADFPSRPIKIIIPAAPGGISDMVGRALALEMGKKLGATSFVDNRPGGNFGIALTAAKNADADGYTLVLFPGSPFTIYPHLYKALPYSASDFSWIGIVMAGHQVLAVRKDHPAKTLDEYLSLVRKSAEPALVAVSSSGGLPHLMMELLATRARIKVQPVVYKGETPAVLDLLGGNVPAVSASTPAVIQHFKNGDVRILAISSETRIAEMPTVPTFKESGFQDMVIQYVLALAAPRRTPDDVLKKLQAAAAASVGTSTFKSALGPDMHPVIPSARALSESIQTDSNRWGALIRDNHIVVDQ